MGALVDVPSATMPATISLPCCRRRLVLPEFALFFSLIPSFILKSTRQSYTTIKLAICTLYDHLKLIESIEETYPTLIIH